MEENNNNTEPERKLSAGKSKLASEENKHDGDEYLSEDELEVIRNEDAAVNNIAKGESPLDQPVVERSYTERKYVGDTMSPIPEPKDNFQPPSAPQQPAANQQTKKDEKRDLEEKRQEDKRFAKEGLGEIDAKSGGGNPAAETMTDAEKKKYVEQTVDTALHTYEKVWNWLAQWLQISDNKLVKRVRAGKCPPDWAVLYDSATNEALTLREFIHMGNEKIVEACKTDPKWLATVRPLAIDEFYKRNWVITPKNNLIFLLLEDGADKAQKLFMAYMAMNKVMTDLDKEFAERKKTGAISLRDDYNARLYGYNPNAQRTASPDEQIVQQQQQQPPPPPPAKMEEKKEEEEVVFEVPVD